MYNSKYLIPTKAKRSSSLQDLLDLAELLIVENLKVPRKILVWDNQTASFVLESLVFSFSNQVILSLQYFMTQQWSDIVQNILPIDFNADYIQHILFYLIREMPRHSFLCSRNVHLFIFSSNTQLPLSYPPSKYINIFNLYLAVLLDRTCGPRRAQPPALEWPSPRGTTRYSTTTTTQTRVNLIKFVDTTPRYTRQIGFHKIITYPYAIVIKLPSGEWCHKTMFNTVYFSFLLRLFGMKQRM